MTHYTPQPLPKMSASEKYEANLSAIRALRRIETEKREATETERAALSCYTGWGDTEVRRYAFRWDGRPSVGLLRALGVEIPADVDGEYVRLDSLAAPASVAAALRAMQHSTLNAHYTSVEIARAIWRALLRMGYGTLRAPRVLEPSAGTGVFLGTIPLDESDTIMDRVIAVELDAVTAAVCRALYPSADVRQGAFQDVALSLPPGTLDVVIGNVPFGDYAVADAEDGVPHACRKQIHDYFVCRAITLLRPGGVAALITSKGTLDKESPTVRKWIAQRARLLGAFRLPGDAFEENAGTSVTTDVLFFQRKIEDGDDADAEWIEERREVAFMGYGSGESRAQVNAHFVAYPERVLGEWYHNKLAMWPDAGVRRRVGDPPADELLSAAIAALPAGCLGPIPGGRKRSAAALRGTLTTSGDLTPATAQEMALGRVLRTLRAMLAAHERGEDTSRLRALLRSVYGMYTSAYGSVRSAERDSRHPLHRYIDDRWWALIASLEDGSGRPSRVFEAPQTRQRSATAPQTAADALYQLLDEAGAFSPQGIADRLAEHGVATTADAVRQELRGQIFQSGPDGEWITREHYLSGDVVDKLDVARKWARLDPSFVDNVNALESVQPKPIPFSDIAVPFGAPWVEPRVYVSFMRHLFPSFDGWGVSLEYVEATATWLFSVSNRHLIGSIENQQRYATSRITAIDLIDCGLRLRLPVVYDDVADPDSPTGTKRVRNEQETSLAQAKLQEIREIWAEWLPRDKDRAATLEAEYNRRYNRIVPRAYDGSHLTFPGLSSTMGGKPLNLRRHQRAGALRMVERGEIDDTAGLGYYPGAGKTLTAICGAVKRLQLGLSQKVAIVVPKAVLGQWQQTFYDVYPGLADWMLVGTDRAFDERNRRAFLLQAAMSDARIVLLTYEQFRTIPVRPATFGAYLTREIVDLEAALLDAEGDDDGAKKNLERAFKARQQALADFEARYASKWKKISDAGNADIAWEAWGVDLLIVDEGHSFKRDVFMTKMDGVSGLPRGESQRAFDMRVKLHYTTTPDLFPGPIEGRAPGKAVFLTGTMVTNTLVETWIMMRLLQPNLLRKLGLWQFDAWAATFTTPKPSPEMDAVGAWKVRTRLKFHNLPELQDMIGAVWDRLDPREAEGTRPAIVNGRMRIVETTGSEELVDYTEELAERAEAVRKREVPPDVDNMLKITHDGRCASVFNGRPSKTWPTDRRTKLDTVALEAWDLYVHSDAMSGCLLIFVDMFTPKAASTADAGIELTPEEIFVQQGVYGVLRDKMCGQMPIILPDGTHAKIPGMLPREVAFIHDAASDAERADLFDRANRGEIRALIGSTAKMGLGVNVQRRAYAVLHVTVPWRPDQLDQANKRADRDGNLCEAVHLIAFPTTGSYDVVLWQMIEIKGEFVSQINSGTYNGRSADDIGDLVIDATTAKAVALGDLRVIEKVKLELELSQLQRSFRAWKNDTIRARFDLESLPRQVDEKQSDIEELQALKRHRDASQIAHFTAMLRPIMSAGGKNDEWQAVNDRTAADQRVHTIADSLRHKLGADGVLIGTYRGLTLSLVRDGQGIHMVMAHGDGAELTVKGVGQRGGVGAFAQAEMLLATVESQIHKLSTQLEILRQRHASLSAAPAWQHAERAAAALARYEELCAAVATNGIVDRQTFRFQ